MQDEKARRWAKSVVSSWNVGAISEFLGKDSPGMLLELLSIKLHLYDGKSVLEVNNQEYGEESGFKI